MVVLGHKFDIKAKIKKRCTAWYLIMKRFEAEKIGFAFPRRTLCVKKD
jgi:hypothetical protein